MACWDASGSPTVGMASAKNLAWLRDTGRRYIIGAPKSELKAPTSRSRVPLLVDSVCDDLASLVVSVMGLDASRWLQEKARCPKPTKSAALLA